MLKEMKAPSLLKPGTSVTLDHNPERRAAKGSEVQTRGGEGQRKDALSCTSQENCMAHSKGKPSEPLYLDQWGQVCGLMAGASLDPVWPEGEAEKMTKCKINTDKS